MRNNIKVMIAAGGTGGHLFPGIAIAEEIRRRHPDARIVFAGTARGLEATILPRLGWQLVLLTSASIKDRSGIGKAIALARLPLFVIQAAGVLLSDRPDLIVSIGGYAAGPLALAAWILRVRIVAVEPNAIPGFANRMIGRLAGKIFTAFDDAAGYFPRRKVMLSGNPVRGEVLAARRASSAVGDRFTIFVFGGSQGAQKLNQGIIGALPELAKVKDKIRIIHQTGGHIAVKDVEAAYANAGVEAKVFKFVDKIWECYLQADLVVARAGATTVAELAALALPSILVPYPYAADDHQRANARGMARMGGAMIIEDSDLTGPRLAREIEKVLSEPARLKVMHDALANAGRPDAAKTIVEESWRLIAQSSKLKAQRNGTNI